MRYLIILIYLVIISILSSCYEREEACLDLLAQNYTITADDACDECCEYPTLQLRAFPMLGDSLYNMDSVITNNAGQSYFIRDAVIILSKFELALTDTTLKIRETAAFEDTDDSSIDLIDDHVVLKVSSSVLDIGSIRENGDVDSLSFLVGVDHELVSVNEESVIFDYDTLYTDQGYYDISLYLTLDASLQMNKIVRFYLNIEESRILLLPTDVSKEERLDFGLQVEIDYKTLLNDIIIEETEDVQIISDYILPDEFIKILE
jgi:hypothetical protein